MTHLECLAESAKFHLEAMEYCDSNDFNAPSECHATRAALKIYDMRMWEESGEAENEINS